jgi:uncharacterized membrane protein HdeD (DUF308 family)
MTANVSHPGEGATARRSGRRTAVGLLGVAVVVLGIVLLFHPVAAARSLALLIGLAFVVGGALEIAIGWDTHVRAGALVLGGILVVGGILAVVWPGVTLFAVALVTGLSLIAHGAVRVGIAVMERRELPGWGWFALLGAVGVVVGVLAIAWPQATVLVLSVVLGLQITLLGLALVFAGFWRSGAEREVQPRG